MQNLVEKLTGGMPLGDRAKVRDALRHWRDANP